MSFYENEAINVRKPKKHVRIMENNPSSESKDRLSGGGKKSIYEVDDLTPPRIGLSQKDLHTKINVPPEYQQEYKQQIELVRKKLGPLTTYLQHDLLQSEVHRLGVHYTLLNRKIKQLKLRDSKRLLSLKDIDPTYGTSAFRKLDEQKLSDYIEEMRKPPKDRLTSEEYSEIQDVIAHQKAEADSARDIAAGGRTTSSATAIRRPQSGRTPPPIRRPQQQQQQPPPPTQVFREPSPVRQPISKGPRIVKPDSGTVVCPGGARISKGGTKQPPETAGEFKIITSGPPKKKKVPQKQVVRPPPPKIMVQPPTIRNEPITTPAALPVRPTSSATSVGRLPMHKLRVPSAKTGRSPKSLLKAYRDTYLASQQMPSSTPQIPGNVFKVPAIPARKPQPSVCPTSRIPTEMPRAAMSATSIPSRIPSRTGISGKTFSDRRLEEIIQRKKMLARPPIQVGDDIALPPSACVEPVLSSTLSRRQAYVSENIPAVKLRDPRTVRSPPKAIIGSAFEKRLDYEAPSGVALQPKGQIFMDPKYQAYERQVRDITESYGGKYEELASKYQSLQNEYKRRHMMTPPKMPRMDVLLDVEKKKSQKMASSAAAKRRAYKPEVQKTENVVTGQSKTLPAKLPEKLALLKRRKSQVIQRAAEPVAPIVKPQSSVDIRKQYAAAIAQKVKLKPPPSTRIQQETAPPAATISALDRRKQYQAPKPRVVTAKASAPSVCESAQTVPSSYGASSRGSLRQSMPSAQIGLTPRVLAPSVCESARIIPSSSEAHKNAVASAITAYKAKLKTRAVPKTRKAIPAEAQRNAIEALMAACQARTESGAIPTGSRVPSAQSGLTSVPGSSLRRTIPSEEMGLALRTSVPALTIPSTGIGMDFQPRISAPSTSFSPSRYQASAEEYEALREYEAVKEAYEARAAAYQAQARTGAVRKGFKRPTMAEMYLEPVTVAPAAIDPSAYEVRREEFQEQVKGLGRPLECPSTSFSPSRYQASAEEYEALKEYEAVREAYEARAAAYQAQARTGAVRKGFKRPTMAEMYLEPVTVAPTAIDPSAYEVRSEEFQEQVKGLRRPTMTPVGAEMNYYPDLQEQACVLPEVRASTICDVEEPKPTAFERKSIPRPRPRQAPEKQKTIRDLHKEFEEKRINDLIEEARTKPTFKPKTMPSTVCPPESASSITALERRQQYASQIPLPAFPTLPRPSPEKVKTIRDSHREYEASRIQRMLEEIETGKAEPKRTVSRASLIEVEPELSALEKRKQFSSKVPLPRIPTQPKKAPEKPKTSREIQKEYEAKRRQQMLEEETTNEIVRKALTESGDHTEDIIGAYKEPPKKVIRPPRLKPISAVCKPSATEMRRKYELDRKEKLSQGPSREDICKTAAPKKKPGELPKPPDDPKEKARKMKEYEEKRREEIKQRKEEVLKKLVDVRTKRAGESTSLQTSIVKDKSKKGEPRRVRISIASPRGARVAELPEEEQRPTVQCTPAEVPEQEPQYAEMLEKLYSKHQNDLTKIEDTIGGGALGEDVINELEDEKEFLQMELEIHENAIRELPQARAKVFDNYLQKVEAAMAAGGDNVLKNSLYNEYKQNLADLEVACGMPRPDVDDLSFVSPKRPIVFDMEELVKKIKEQQSKPPKPQSPPAPPPKIVRPKPLRRIKSFLGMEEEKKKAAAAEKKRIQENITKMIKKQQDLKRTLKTIQKKPTDPRPEALVAPQEAMAEQLRAQADLESAVNTRLAKRKTDPITQSAIAKEQADDIFKEMMIQHAGGDFSKDPADLGGLLVQSAAPKLPLIGAAAEADINEGVLTRQIPTAEINALNTITNEEIGINIQITENLPIPATNVAHAAIPNPEDITLDFGTRNPPTKEHLEVAVTLDSFYVENHFQARGSAWPKWFPGYFTAFPGENTNVILQKSPSDVLYKAWEMLKPPYVDSKCLPTHRKVEVCI